MRNGELGMLKGCTRVVRVTRALGEGVLCSFFWLPPRFLTGAVLIGMIASLWLPQVAHGAEGVERAPYTDAGVVTAATGGTLEWVLFNLLAGGVVVSVIGVCVSRNIVRMAVWLFMCLGGVAMLYFMLAANFLGAIQLIVYAGGTLVLLIFGVMLTSKSPWVRWEAPLHEVIVAALVCVAMLSCLCIVLGRTVWAGVEAVVPGPALSAIGEKLLTTYLVPFEVAGVLLMIVMVGAAHLARQEE